jgi:hypothetical protein
MSTQHCDGQMQRDVLCLVKPCMVNNGCCSLERTTMMHAQTACSRCCRATLYLYLLLEVYARESPSCYLCVLVQG